MIKFIVFIMFSISCAVSAESIRITELMSNNATSLYDSHSNTPDWIEIVNSGVNPVNLKSYKISDNNNFANAWQLPDTVLAPKQRILICASGYDTVLSDTWTIESSGWGIYQHVQKDSYRFEYLKVSGDFDISVEMSCVHPIQGKAPHAGLLVKEELDDISLFVALLYWNVSNFNYYWLTYRNVLTELPKYQFPNFTNQNKPGWLRMIRSGDSVFAICEDGEGYIQEINSRYFPKKEVYIGIASASTDPELLSKAYFRNLKINGTDFDVSKLKSFEKNVKYQGKKYKTKEFHTDFKIADEGEIIYLWKGDSTLCEKISLPKLPPDVSSSKLPETSDTLKFSLRGTPGKPNLGNEYYLGIVDPPEFSVKNSWSKDPTIVSIKSDSLIDSVKYTLDGSEPCDASFKYFQPLNIVKNTIIKAKAYRNSYMPSQTSSRTYFISDSSSIPVMSIGATPSFLTNNNSTGLFDKLFSNIRIPASIEYFDSEKNRVHESTAELRLTGHGAARGFNQPSIRLDNRNYLGNTNFTYNFFGNRSLKEYETLKLRNASGDWEQSFLRDVLGCALANRIPTQIGAGYQPVLSFINGEFFGLYNLREHINESFLAVKFNIPEDSVNIMKNFSELTAGSVNHFFKFYDQFEKADIQSESGKELAESNLDVYNVLDYTILSFYVSNFDWPGNNITQWRSGAFDGKWRFVANDFDWSFSWDEYVTDPDNDCLHRFFSNENIDNKFAFIVNKLLQNKKYADYFVNKSADLLNSVFMKEPVISLIDSLKGNISKEIDRQRKLRPDCMKLFDYSYYQMLDFANRRPDFLRKDIAEHFNLPGFSKIKISTNNEQNIRIRVNSLISEGNVFEGVYFWGVPIEIEILGGSDKNFKGWSDAGLPVNKKIVMILDHSIELIANFREEQNSLPVVINEIMYKAKSDEDCRDWFELFNPNNIDISLAGFSFRDDNDKHIYNFHDSLVIKAQDYLIVAQSPDDYKYYNPDVRNTAGPFDFGIGTSDKIRIFDNKAKLIDSVDYSNQYPWPDNATETGLSIELINPVLDNNIPQNWKSSFKKSGTAGEINTVFTGIDFAELSVNGFKLYPNPASEKIFADFHFEKPADYELRLETLLGEILVSVRKNHQMKCLEEISLTDYPSGIYLVKLISGDKIVVQKFIKK